MLLKQEEEENNLLSRKQVHEQMSIKLQDSSPLSHPQYNSTKKQT